jgi:hypothetical protein
MPPPIENNAAQGQSQDLQFVDVGHYDMGYDHPPPQLGEHHDNAINNYAEVAIDVPAQAHAAQPAPVCTDPHSSAYMYLTRHFA